MTVQNDGNIVPAVAGMLRLGAAAALLVWLVACGGQAPAPDQARQPARGATPGSPALTPTPSHGPGSTPAANPRRIISLVPAVTEMLYAIGAGPRMVGVSSFDTYPPDVKALPKVGGLLDPNLERIISLKPDLVIVSESHTDLRAQLRSAGIAAFPHALGDLANVTRTIRALGTATGFEWQAGLVAQTIESRLDAVRKQVGDRPRPSTMLVFGRAPGSLREIYVSGGTGFLHDLLVLAGGTNTFDQIKREGMQATTETILTAAPDVIIELLYGRQIAPASLDRERLVWNALSSVPAIRTGRVHFLIGDELVVPGPRVADTAERMARVLHADAYGR